MEICNLVSVKPKNCLYIYRLFISCNLHKLELTFELRHSLNFILDLNPVVKCLELNNGS